MIVIAHGYGLSYKILMGISFDESVKEIINAGRRLDALGCAPAGGGNYSCRLDSKEIAITVSGAHKGSIKADQVMRVDNKGLALEDKIPSAETLLHTLLYDIYPKVNAVLHTHSVACVVLTRLLSARKEVILDGYELQKVFAGVKSHDTRVSFPVFDNSQDIKALSGAVREVLEQRKEEIPVFLIRGHGLYGWGTDMQQCLNVVEAAETLLKCELELLKLGNNKKDLLI